MLAAREFLLIMGLGFIVAGLTTYVMTWVLVSTHLRDHHPAERKRLGGFLFTPRAFGWYLGRGYIKTRDPNLTGIARLGFVGAWGIVIGLLAILTSYTMGVLGVGA
ncbi:MAG: hypothetical protein ABI650_04920 [Dokdonella sp.]